jgi:hypothetical protein
MVRLLAALALALPLLTGCGKSNGPKDVLIGRVTVGGQPAKAITLVAIDESGKETSTYTKETGEYEIVNPPKGKLRFRLGSLVPPAPPGVLAPPPPPGTVKIPAKYQSEKNELGIEYSGGSQQYDISI